MPQEIFYPFSLDARGGIAFTTNPDVIALQHVEALVGTTPGERVMLPNYGVPVASYVFANGADAVIAGLTNDVERQMSLWEPSLHVIAVIPALEPDNDNYGVAAIDVQFSQAQNSTSVNTATVEIGGKVIESIVSNAT